MAARAAVVVDTNVAVTANGDAEHASVTCQQQCVNCLVQVTAGQCRLVLDQCFEIFNEYRCELSLSGQPGVGDIFMKWVHDNQFNEDRCERVPLTASRSRGFKEFPDDPDLRGFDPDDRKFVAVALASKYRPRILNAVDSDWWDFKAVLRRNGIRVTFLCDDQVTAWRSPRARM